MSLAGQESRWLCGAAPPSVASEQEAACKMQGLGLSKSRGLGAGQVRAECLHSLKLCRATHTTEYKALGSGRLAHSPTCRIETPKNSKARLNKP